LISDLYNERIALKIRYDKTLPIDEYGLVAEAPDNHGTTHLNVVDKEGMVVQITSTINLEFGAKYMDVDTGIIFNSQIDDFSIKNVKNFYDFPLSKANRLESGKRPFSSAAPVIIVGPDEKIIMGAAGGSRIPTSIIAVLMYMMMGVSMDEAINGPRIHQQLVPNKVYVEKNFSENIIKELEKRGHDVEISDLNTVFTSVQGIHLKTDGEGRKKMFAISDKRKMGLSAGE